MLFERLATDRCVFDYRASWKSILGAILFFGSCAWFGEFKATHDHQALLIDGLIELSPAHASAFYWVLAGVGAAFVFVAIGTLLASIGNDHELVLDGHGLSAPKWAWSRRPTVVPYADIRSVRMMHFREHRYLRVGYGVRKLEIMEGRFPPGEFDAFCHELSRRMKTASPRVAA